MTSDQMDLFESMVTGAGAQWDRMVMIHLAGLPAPLTGQYHRVDNRTIILHTGGSGQWFIDISNITAIGVR